MSANIHLAFTCSFRFNSFPVCHIRYSNSLLLTKPEYEDYIRHTWVQCVYFPSQIHRAFTSKQHDVILHFVHIANSSSLVSRSL